MKRIVLICSFFFCLTFIINAKENRTKEKEKIQVAILLDVSGSMSGLIDQAKARLWNIVNTLTTLRYNGDAPPIEIALYAYGSHNRYDGDYIRQLVPLTADLDRISENLFALNTGGSEEFCGTVILRSVNELEWGNNPKDMKLIYIAGNEIFEQGKVPYKQAIEKAVSKGIYVNTIHCGDRKTGIRDYWQDAANRGRGEFFNIDHNATVRHIETPYDARIIECNERLNNTYLGYGRRGAERKKNQTAQDQNAMSMSQANYAERSVSKSKAIYNNSSWDLVDLAEEDNSALDKLKKEELPAELKDKSHAEIKQIVNQKATERKEIQAQITELDKQRRAYIDNETKKENNSKDDLGNAITQSIIKVANEKGYKEAK